MTTPTRFQLAGLQRLQAVRQRLLQQAQTALKDALESVAQAEAALAERPLPGLPVSSAAPAALYVCRAADVERAQALREQGLAHLGYAQDWEDTCRAALLARHTEARQADTLCQRAVAKADASAAKKASLELEDWLRRKGDKEAICF